MKLDLVFRLNGDFIGLTGISGSGNNLKLYGSFYYTGPKIRAPYYMSKTMGFKKPINQQMT